MHSWVYRNRSRLKLIYGSAPAPLPPLPAPAPLPALSAPEPEAAQEPAPHDAPLPDEDSGRVVRRASYVLLHPMPPRRL